MSGAAGRSRVRRAPAGVVGVLALVLVLLLAACTSGPASPEPSEAADGDGVVPAIPGVSEPAASSAPGPAATAAPPTPQVRAGDHVLVDLEGRVTNRDAADVVVRTERGVELERFRLAGAIAVQAEPGGRWALVNTLEGGWAVLDGAEATLALLPFDGQSPRTTPQMRGPLAWWNDPVTPWLARLDGGDPIDLAALVGEPVEVQSVTADGSHALAVGSRSYVIDTATVEVRAIDQTTFVSLADDGRLLQVSLRDGGGALLTVESAAGGDLRELALLSRPGQPVALPDGEVLVAGEASTVVDDRGGQRSIPPVRGVSSPPIVTGEGVVVVPTIEGITLVDLPTGTVTVVADTVGHTRPVGTGRWLWSVTADAEAPGALVIDTETGDVTPLLPDTPTSAIGSVTMDGSWAAVLTGAGGTDAVILGVDGTSQPVVGDARVVGVALHPSGTFSAAALVVETDRLLLVREGTSQQAQIDTGRSPVWLRTAE